MNYIVYITSKRTGRKYKVGYKRYALGSAVPVVCEEWFKIFGITFWASNEYGSFGGSWDRPILSVEYDIYHKNTKNLNLWYEKAIFDVENYKGYK